MSRFFLLAANMSLAASVIGLVVALLRQIFKARLPRWIFYLAWVLVLLRLLLPFAPASSLSAFSAVPGARAVTPGEGRSALLFVEETGAAVPFPTLQTPELPEETAPVIAAAPVGVTTILASIWLCGFLLLLGYSLLCYFYTLVRLRSSQPVEITGELLWVFKTVGVSPKRVRVCRCALFESPVLCGLLRPRLILTADTGQEELCHVAAHELEHLRRRDNLWKALATLALYLHWFNPLIWVFYRLYVGDLEASCDEAALRATKADRKAYASSLLQMAAKGRNAFAGGFLSFGECALKERVKSIMRVKKNTVMLSLLCMAVIAGLAVVFLTNPRLPVQASLSDPDAETVREALGSLMREELLSITFEPADGSGGGWTVPPDGMEQAVSLLRALKPSAGADLPGRETAYDYILYVNYPDGRGLRLSLSSQALSARGKLSPLLPGKEYACAVGEPEAHTLLAYLSGLAADRPGGAAATAQLPANTPEPTPAPTPVQAAGVPPKPESTPEPTPEESPEPAPVIWISGNPDYLRLRPEDVSFMNLIDRDTHTYIPIAGSLQAEVIEDLNAIRPQRDLSSDTGERGVLLLQISFNDGARQEYWFYPEVLVVAGAQVAGPEQISPLLSRFEDLLAQAREQNALGAEWLGFMNPYRITRLTDTWAGGGTTEASAAASQTQREKILSFAAGCKALRVTPEGDAARLTGDPSVFSGEAADRKVSLSFGPDGDDYEIWFFSQARVLTVRAKGIGYYTRYHVHPDDTWAALTTQE